MTIKNVSVKKMNPAPYNPRERLEPGSKDYESLKKSIEKYGFVQPIVWNERTGNIVGGHQRYYIALDLKMKSVSTKIVDLDEAEEKQLNLGLNKISGQWDEKKLSELLNDLKGFDDIDMELTGFDPTEIDELTLAFSNTELDIDMDMGESEDPEGPGIEMDEPLTAEFEPEDESNSSGLEYKITFDDEQQQAIWHEFLRKLKEDFDTEAFPTQSSRIHAFLVKKVFTNGEDIDFY